MAVPDYVVRMQQEAADLGDRHHKLEQFMQGDVYKGLGLVDQQLLVVQRFVMFNYLQVLCERISRADFS